MVSSVSLADQLRKLFMSLDRSIKPKIRPGVDAAQFDHTAEGMVTLYDSSLLSSEVLEISPPVLWIIGHFDGLTTLSQIEEKFAKDVGRPLEPEQLDQIVDLMEKSRFLEGPAFERYYAGLVDQYRQLPARPALNMGLDNDQGELTGTLNDFLIEGNQALEKRDLECPPAEAIAGAIAPHLDYPRGGPCYGITYSLLAKRPAPQRIIILGTNHNPRTFAPIASGLPFETPIGTTPADVAFVEAMESRCGNMRRCELDHVREHSIELQLIWCQHLWGADAFELVPILCTDVHVPQDVFPGATECYTTDDVGEVIRDLLAKDDKDTLIIAGADLSHIGSQFGDERLVDEEFLEEIRKADESVLECLGRNDSKGFHDTLAGSGNPTRICSTGCLYLLMKCLPDSAITILDYHQAVSEEFNICVSCAAGVCTAKEQ